MSRKLLTVVGLIAFLPLAHADVIVVDSSGAGDLRDVQAAVDAARDGDVILLRRPPVLGTQRFGAVSIVGKSVTLVGIELDPAPVEQIEVRRLPPGGRVVLSNLDVQPHQDALDTAAPPAALFLEANQGSVRIEDCRVTGVGTYSCAPWDAGPAVAAIGSDDVVASGGVWTGGSPDFGSVDDGAPGVVVERSRMAAHGVTITGGEGGGPYTISCSQNSRLGGAGVQADSGAVLLSDCVVTGGAGGTSEEIFEPPIGGDGGTGLVVAATASVFLRDGSVAGGAGGVGLAGNGATGPDTAGAPTSFAGAARRLSAPAHAFDDGLLPLVFAGEPGDVVTLLVSSTPAPRLLVDVPDGALLVGKPFRRVAMGTIPASGVLSAQLMLPDVVPGAPTPLYLQGAFLPTGGSEVLGEARHVAVADGADDPCALPAGGTRRVYVDADAAPGGDGASWATAMGDLRAALAAAPGCAVHPAEVWVAEGTYRPAPAGGDRHRTFAVWSGTRLYGGFAGSETNLSQRDPDVHVTRLDGDLDADDLPDFGNIGDNAYHVVTAGTRLGPARRVRVDGFWIRGGHGNAPGPNRGGGVLIHGSGALVDCVVADCDSQRGGGAWVEGGNIQVVGCRFIGNVCLFPGGGLSAVSTEGPILVASSVFAGNEGFHQGGGGAYIEGDVTVAGCTFWANEGSELPAGLRIEGSDAHVVNTVFWGNQAYFPGSVEKRQIQAPAGWKGLDHSCVHGLSGGLGGVGNVGQDPGFLDRLGPDGVGGTLDDDLRPGDLSPCVDAGDVTAVPKDLVDLDGDGDRAEPLPFDVAGAPRIVDDPAVTDGGVGGPPVVDMGAYERQP